MGFDPLRPQAIHSAATLALAAALAIVASQAAANQGLIVRDRTLGGVGGVVGEGTDDLGMADYLITADLGEQRGGNLFHSFASFSIGSRERATFTDQGAPNPGAIEHVISRVTGGSVSAIDGTLHSTIPGADLWLINPTGIVFGAGAQLDVPGSFHAATADALDFDDAGLVPFYADSSRQSVLSVAEPRAFGFLGSAASGVPSLRVEGSALAVPAGEMLSLASRDGLALDGAQFMAPGAHVTLEAQGEIVLSDSRVDVGGMSPGAVAIRGGRLAMTQGSRVLAENRGGGGGGTISIEATAGTDSVIVDDSLLSVSTHSAGDAGTIRVKAPEVRFQNGPGLPDFPTPPPIALEVGATADTFGGGAGGTIRIEASALTLENGVALIASAAGGGATGNAGTIQLTGGSVAVSDRSFIYAGPYLAPSNGGAILIDLSGTLRVDGAARLPNVAGNPPYAFIGTSADTGGAAPGRIEIHARSVEFVNGGEMDNACYGCTSKTGDPGRPPDAGRIRIEADRVVVAGPNLFEGFLNNSFIDVGTFGRLGSAGDAGKLEIHAGSLELREGGFLAAGTDLAGNAGVIEVVADSVVLENGSTIGANSRFGGDAGTIRVQAKNSVFVNNEGGDEFDRNGSWEFNLNGVLEPGQPGFSGIYTVTVGGGAGGSIRLDAPDITLTDGSIVATSTVGGGAGGPLVLHGDRIRIANGSFIDTTSLPLPLGNPFPLGGNAGSVTLDASESIEIVGHHPEFGGVSRVASASLGSGKAGDVTLRAPRILVDGGAVVTTAAPYRLRQGSPLEGEGGGTITIEAGELRVANGGRIDASSFIAGAGGSVNVTVSESIGIEGAGSGIASRTGGAGVGGRVALRAPQVELRDGGEVSAESAPGLGELAPILANLFEGAVPAAATGDAGSVTLTADEVWLSGGAITTNAETADGGDVRIAATRLVRLTDGAITASVAGGAGGSVLIDPALVLLEDSVITANATQLGGSGGQIGITSDLFFMRGASLLDASAPGGPLRSGSIEIHSPDVDLSGTLTALPAAFLDASSLLHERCPARRSGARAGTFTVRGTSGVAAEPDAPLAANGLVSSAHASAGEVFAPLASAWPRALLASRSSCD